MSEAVITQTENQVLSPLQQAAKERIDFFTQELARKGLYVRSAMELEFITLDEGNKLVTDSIPMEALPDLANKMNDNLIKAGLSPNVECVGPETVYKDKTDLEQTRPDIAHQYEINVSDNATNPELFKPINVADSTAYIKQNLKQALSSTTSLTPCFMAAPHIGSNRIKLPIELRNKIPPDEYPDVATSGMHLNISIYDDKQNLYLNGDETLLQKGAKSLVRIQQTAALSMLPFEASLHRINLNHTAPNGIGVVLNKKIPERAGDYTSVSIRKDANDPDCLDSTRIESRLAGADADPYVAMAVTLAAIYNSTLETPVIDYTSPSHYTPAIPQKHSEIIKRFREDKQLKGLLGEKLYHAILEEYGQQQALAH